MQLQLTGGAGRQNGFGLRSGSGCGSRCGRGGGFLRRRDLALDANYDHERDQADEHDDHLHFLRQRACQLMALLQRFNPYLAGAVLDGTAGRFAEIDIQLFADSAKDVEIFLLNENLQVKRLSFLDVLKEQTDGQAENEDERFDGDFALMTGEVARLLDDLLGALGGEQPRAE